MRFGLGATVATLATLSSPVVAQADSMNSVYQFVANLNKFSSNMDTWRYFLLELQVDNTNTGSGCLSYFDEYRNLYEKTKLEVADRTDYEAGLALKGNGEPTTVGFYGYQALKWMDVAVSASNIYNNCQMENYFLSVGKAVTSVSGASDMLMTFILMYFNEDDNDKYTALAQAVTDGDAIVAGSMMGWYVRSLLKTDIAEIYGDADYYTPTDGRVRK